MSEFPELQNKFLQVYLKYTEDTESPKLFHTWAALTGVSASLGRRCYFDFGIGPLYPNMYCLLVGPPATRKSTAMNFIVRRVEHATDVRIAPKDTAGQRQGLLRAMIDEDELDDETTKAVNAAFNYSGSQLLEELGGVEIRPRSKLAAKDNHCMFVAATEFTTITGVGNSEILTFLQMVYDGEDYDYRLKNEHIKLFDPLLSMIGCTTPTNIANSMPQAAIGQGFMSRIIFVYASYKEKNVVWPSTPDAELEKYIDSRLNELQNKFEGPFTLNPSAKATLEAVYGVGDVIPDHRFIFYFERRFSHILKLCMCLAAAEGKQEIEVTHVEDGLALLAFTEQFMPDALGEFGMSPLSQAKQKLMDFATSINEPVTVNVLWQVMHNDMLQRDFSSALADLVNANKLLMVTTDAGPAYIAKNSTATQVDLLTAMIGE